MNDEAQLLVNIWELFSDYIPNNEKLEICELLIKKMVDNGCDTRLLYDADGADPWMDRALSALEEEDEDFFDEVDER